jgi:hypothetical protein
LSLATGVNENGDIVGWGDTADGRYAIKWSLVPEPTTQVLLLVGALALLSSRRHHAVNSCLRDTSRDSTVFETANPRQFCVRLSASVASTNGT